MENMSTIRRIAQVVNDLKTLKIINTDDISCMANNIGQIFVSVRVPKDDNSTSFLVKYAFKEEFKYVDVRRNGIYLEFRIIF